MSPPLRSVLLLLAAAGLAAAAVPKGGKGGDLPNGGKIWAVLVAGSRMYDNYRHQADVCHAYHVSSQTFFLIFRSLFKACF